MRRRDFRLQGRKKGSYKPKKQNEGKMSLSEENSHIRAIGEFKRP